MKLKISLNEERGENPDHLDTGWQVRDVEIQTVKDAREVFCNYTYSPHEWINGRRLGEKYIRSFLFIADYDSGFTIDQAKQKFKDHQYILITSRTHQKIKEKKEHLGEVDRFHVIFPIQTFITDSIRYSDIADTVLFKESDKSAYLSTQCFFASPNDAEIFLNFEGKILDIDTLQYSNKTISRVVNDSGAIKRHLPGGKGLEKIRANCSVVDNAFNSIENDQVSNTPGHQKRILTANMIKNTLNENNEQYALELFSNTSDFNRETTLKQYHSIKGNPVTCKKLQSSEWSKMCSGTCPLMSDIGKRSPIAFAYREDEQLELNSDLLKKSDNDNAFKELALRAKSTDNLLIRTKLIKQISASFHIRETEIKQYMKELKVYDDRFTYVINGKIDEVKAAEFIIGEHKLMRYEEEFYCYRDGIWEKLSQEEVESLIHKKIKEFSSNHVISEVIQAVKRESLVTKNLAEARLDKYVIACKNGLLDVRTNELNKYEPDDYRFQKMNANYDPTSKPQGFLMVVDDLFRGDSDAVQKKMLLQEIMGYLLIPDYSLVKKMFYFYGPKANNGKSTIIDIIYALMGEKYIDSVPLSKLDGFMLKRLAGKHANIVADQDAKTKVPDGVFKQLVGGRDWITADVKYKEAINFKNTARLIFAVNKLPYSQAKDAGYYTRIVTLVFNNKFVVSPNPNDKRQMKADPDLIDEIIETELDGILIWALEGLDRLLANKKLTIPQSSTKALDEYQKENNSILLFVDETCKLGSAYSIDRTELYDKYKVWCEGNGFDKKVNANTFYKTLEMELGVLQKKGHSRRMLIGIQYFIRM